MSHQHTETEIEGLVFRNETTEEWEARFSTGTGRIISCRIDYCPWCGKELK